MSYLDDISAIWEAVKESLLPDLGKTITQLWLEPLKVTSFDNNVITFSVETELNYKIVKERYLSIIASGFSLMLGFDVEVDVIYKNANAEQITEQKPSVQNTENNESNKNTEIKDQSIFPQNYNFQYTFDNFIVGNSNKFAHAACTAVAERPAMDYNPLFIYGPSGLGKTHLMSAVVNEIRRKKPNTCVVYIKGDEFTNEMIDSLKNHEMSKFHEKYRNCDILLIDDIQFIAGKDSTQEEFFHTFNNLYESNKQIILTSDRPPKDIKTLEDRLKTRFEWGLIADVQPPDTELRVAIIKKKAEQINITIPDDVLNFLAENLRSNIRQLEGAIKKLSAQCFLSGKSISIDMAKGCIAELLGGAEPVSVTVDKIFSAIFHKYNITKDDLIGTKRNKDIAQARHVSIYLIREITEMSFPNIAKIFSKDHATIMASCKLIEKKISSDPLFNLEIDGLIKDVTV